MQLLSHALKTKRASIHAYYQEAKFLPRVLPDKERQYYCHYTIKNNGMKGEIFDKLKNDGHADQLAFMDLYHRAPAPLMRQTLEALQKQIDTGALTKEGYLKKRLPAALEGFIRFPAEWALSSQKK